MDISGPEVFEKTKIKRLIFETEKETSSIEHLRENCIGCYIFRVCIVLV